jgi:hypothetical protein
MGIARLGCAGPTPLSWWAYSSLAGNLFRAVDVNGHLPDRVLTSGTE